jgi:hypothetical protein
MAGRRFLYSCGSLLFPETTQSSELNEEPSSVDLDHRSIPKGEFVADEKQVLQGLQDSKLGIKCTSKQERSNFHDIGHQSAAM